MLLSPFHLAVKVHDLELAREFYGNKMGFEEGRSSGTWIDFNMFGHQFVVHLDEGMSIDVHTSTVDGFEVPVPHFGVVLKMKDWYTLVEHLRAHQLNFAIEPYIRFEGQVGEQGTLFLFDPSGNALEFKGFRNIEKELFAS